MNIVSPDVLRFTPLSLQHPPPWVGHIPFAAWLSWQLRPTCFVELGTDRGNSYFAFCQALKQANISVSAYAVDTWKGDEQARFYSEAVFNYVFKHNEEHYGGFSTLLRMTFDAALELFSEGSIDLLHIDGCHSYEAVKHDFETWLPKLSPGAVVVFHDINVRLPGYGAWRFWEELETQYEHTFAFLHSNGLGVLQVDGNDPAKQLALFSFSPEQQQDFRDVFAVLGSLHQYRYGQDELQKEAHALREAVSGKDALIAEQERILTEQDRALSEKDMALSEKDALLAGKDAVIAEQERVLTEQGHALSGKDTLLAEKDADLGQVRAALTQTDAALQKVLTSKAWRITWPIRAVISALKRCAPRNPQNPAPPVSSDPK
ncbi:class I SAM-dependent methyltransferase [Desulfosarcina sp. OttesenSCG-928-A07]|nr:class I SAM-dependent methyltransferase [Desulfosarcina sp. OttesenSCG-928-A07]